MLVIEGPDLVGKTTLARRLTLELMKQAGAGAPAPGQDKFTVAESAYAVGDYRRRIAPMTVCDRMHLSELAYAVATGRECHLTHRTARLVDAEVRRVGGMVVLLTANRPTYRALLDKYHARGELFDRHVCEQAAAAYESLRLYGKVYGDMAGSKIIEPEFKHRMNGVEDWPGDDFVTEVAKEYLASARAYKTA